MRTFVTNRDSHSFIGVYDPARNKIAWMAPSVDRDTDPMWSPDGRRIAYFRRPGAQYNETTDYWNPPNPAVWVADAETGQAQELWNPSKAEPKYHTIRNLMWAANGRILFTAEHDNSW